MSTFYHILKAINPNDESVADSMVLVDDVKDMLVSAECLRYVKTVVEAFYPSCRIDIMGTNSEASLKRETENITVSLHYKASELYAEKLEEYRKKQEEMWGNAAM